MVLRFLPPSERVNASHSSKFIRTIVMSHASIWKDLHVHVGNDASVWQTIHHTLDDDSMTTIGHARNLHNSLRISSPSDLDCIVKRFLPKDTCLQHLEICNEGSTESVVGWSAVLCHAYAQHLKVLKLYGCPQVLVYLCKPFSHNRVKGLVTTPSPIRELTLCFDSPDRSLTLLRKFLSRMRHLRVLYLHAQMVGTWYGEIIATLHQAQCELHTFGVCPPVEDAPDDYIVHVHEGFIDHVFSSPVIRSLRMLDLARVVLLESAKVVRLQRALAAGRPLDNDLQGWLRSRQLTSLRTVVVRDLLGDQKSVRAFLFLMLQLAPALEELSMTAFDRGPYHSSQGAVTRADPSNLKHVHLYGFVLSPQDEEFCENRQITYTGTRKRGDTLWFHGPLPAFA